jgi:predicted kinase
LNLPEQESNLEAMRPADFEQHLARTRENSKQTLAAGLFGPQNRDRQFWQALLLAALILLLAEPFIANRTSV